MTPVGLNSIPQPLVLLTCFILKTWTSFSWIQVSVCDQPKRSQCCFVHVSRIIFKIRAQTPGAVMSPVTLVKEWTCLQLWPSWLWLLFPPPEWWLGSIRHWKHLSLPIVNYEEKDGRFDNWNQDTWRCYGRTWPFLEGFTATQLYRLKQVMTSRQVVDAWYAPWRCWWMDLLNIALQCLNFWNFHLSSHTQATNLPHWCTMRNSCVG